MANTFTLSGTSLDAQNNPAYAGRYMILRVKSVGTDTEDAASYPQDSVSFLIDENGDWSATGLWVNGDSGVSSVYEMLEPSGQRIDLIFPSAVEGTTVRYEFALENYLAQGAVPQQSPALAAHVADLNNPHVVTPAQLGLVIGTDVQAYDATILVDADIGSTVQAYDAILSGTTASYTTAEKTKLANIEALAEVNDPTTLLDADIGVSVQAWDSALDTIETTITDTDSGIPTSGAVVDYTALNNIASQKIVKQASDLSGTLDSTITYFIDGIVDMGSQSIEVPAGGLSISGATFNVSQLISSAGAYTMFTSPVGGSGDLILKDLAVSTSGAGSSVFGLTDTNGLSSIEIKVVNFNDCTSLGYLDGYRQGLESGTGRFGGTPELEFRNAWIGGYRTETTIARAMGSFTSLFKAGTGFTFDGRVILGMNCDLPTSGSFFDFAPANITNDESLQIANARVTRNGVLDSSDTTTHPNIDHTNVKSLWSNNTGIPNTTKYIKASVITEVETAISVIDTYYPLLGTFNVETSSHLSMPSNGEFELLSGNGSYHIVGDFVIGGGTNDVLDVRVTKSTNGGITYPEEITHIRRQVNALVGGRDVAFFPLNLIATLKAGDRVRLEIENKSGITNVTAEIDSYFIITGI